MKNLVLFIALAFISLFSGCKKDLEVGPGDTPFMEKLTTTLPAQGGEEILKAKHAFFSIRYLISIQEGDTTKQTFPDFKAGKQTISGSWFTVNSLIIDTDALPKEIKISTQENKTGAKRQLSFEVWDGSRADRITILQNTD